MIPTYRLLNCYNKLFSPTSVTELSLENNVDINKQVLHSANSAILYTQVFRELYMQCNVLFLQNIMCV